MKVQKFKNGNISLRLENNESNIDDLFASWEFNDPLFWNDLTIYRSKQDGWKYLYDASQNLVYRLNDYGYNLLDDLYSGKTVRLYAVANNSDYSDYEWNQNEYIIGENKIMDITEFKRNAKKVGFDSIMEKPIYEYGGCIWFLNYSGIPINQGTTEDFLIQYKNGFYEKSIKLYKEK